MSQPYWLSEEPTTGMYRVDNLKLIGQPESPPAFTIKNIFDIGDPPSAMLTITDELVQAGTESGKFEARRTLTIISPVSLAFGSGVALLETGLEENG